MADVDIVWLLRPPIDATGWLTAPRTANKLGTAPRTHVFELTTLLRKSIHGIVHKTASVCQLLLEAVVCCARRLFYSQSIRVNVGS